MFTKARLYADCQNNTTLYHGFLATDEGVNCICILGQDNVVTTQTSLDKHTWLVV